MRAFVEKRFADFIIKQGGSNAARKKRDHIIKKLIINNPVNSLVVNMLIDDRFRNTIFPGHNFATHDLKKLVLLLDIVSGQNPVQYDFLCDNIDAFQNDNIDDEKLPFFFAVVAKRVELSEQIDLPALMKMKIFDLAKNLFKVFAVGDV